MITSQQQASRRCPRCPRRYVATMDCGGRSRQLRERVPPDHASQRRPSQHDLRVAASSAVHGAPVSQRSQCRYAAERRIASTEHAGLARRPKYIKIAAGRGMGRTGIAGIAINKKRLLRRALHVMAFREPLLATHQRLHAARVGVQQAVLAVLVRARALVVAALDLVEVGHLRAATLSSRSLASIGLAD